MVSRHQFIYHDFNLMVRNSWMGVKLVTHGDVVCVNRLDWLNMGPITKKKRGGKGAFLRISHILVEGFSFSLICQSLEKKSYRFQLLLFVIFAGKNHEKTFGTEGIWYDPGHLPKWEQRCKSSYMFVYASYYHYEPVSLGYCPGSRCLTHLILKSWTIL